MRWVPFAILAYLVLLAQGTLSRLISLDSPTLGTIAPDIVATVAVFLALYVRDGLDVMVALWVLGLGLDLTTTGGAGAATVVGPMAVGYPLAGILVYRIRDVFFREWVFTRIFCTVLFCLIAHGMWITWQSLVALETMDWQRYGDLVTQMLLLTVYTALLAPLVHVALEKGSRLLLVGGTGRSSRSSRSR